MRTTPNSKKDTVPFILTDPVGIDSIVKVLQAQLSTDLVWLEKSFNRATIMSRENSAGDDEEYPICFVADGKDQFDMIGNDNWDAYSFFVARGTETPVDFVQFDSNQYERDLSLYVWINLDKANAIQAFEYPEVLKQEIILSVRNAVLLNDDFLKIEGIEDDPLEIFSGFTVDPTITQLLYAPFKGYRFDLSCTYTDTIVCQNGVTPDDDAALWIARMTNPSIHLQNVCTVLVSSAKLAGNFDEWDEIYLHQAGLVNGVVGWKSAIGTVNGGTVALNTGFEHQGTNSFFNSNYTPSIDGVAYTVSDASFGGFIFDHDTGGGGINATAWGILQIKRADVLINGANLSGDFNGAGFANVVTGRTYLDKEQLILGIENTVRTSYGDGISIGSAGGTPDGLPQGSFFSGANNSAGGSPGPTSFFKGIISTSEFGGSVNVDRVAHNEYMRIAIASLISGTLVPDLVSANIIINAA